MSKTLTLQLDDATYELFDEAAKAENRPLASFVQSAVTARIRAARAERGGPPSDLQEAVDEAERGILQGRWVEHEEVTAKLKRWA